MYTASVLLKKDSKDGNFGIRKGPISSKFDPKVGIPGGWKLSFFLKKSPTDLNTFGAGGLGRWMEGNRKLGTFNPSPPKVFRRKRINSVCKLLHIFFNWGYR